MQFCILLVTLTLNESATHQLIRVVDEPLVSVFTTLFVLKFTLVCYYPCVWGRMSAPDTTTKNRVWASASNEFLDHCQGTSRLTELRCFIYKESCGK